MTSTNVKRHDGYIKSLLTTEMVEVVTELNDIIDCQFLVFLHSIQHKKILSMRYSL